ncbi:MAG: cytochrome P450 [Halieaceae bacterium]|nr:cytochrome P450 [Halieaceae bacterium]
MASLSGYSLTDPAVLDYPYEYYEKMRREAPVYFDEGLQAWLVTRYEDIQQAARMTDELSNALGFDQVVRPEWQDEIDEMMRQEGYGPHIISNTVQVDPPLHTRRRRLLNGAFDAKTVAGMEDHIRSIARDAMETFVHRGEADLLAEYAMPIPIMTVCDLLNFPRDRIQEMGQWADSAVAQISMGITREQAYVHARHVMALQAFVMDAIEARRKDPGDDLISHLVHARIEDDENPHLTPEELMPMCLVVVAGGVDTTRNGIAWGLYHLASNPEMFQRLKFAPDGGKLIQRFVEETLRHQTVVPQLPRFAKRECEIGGVTIPEGSSVFLCWGSANYDEDKFTNAGQFDLERKNAGTHAAFGAGIHRCVGNMLARMEMKCAFRELLERFDSLELSGNPEDLELDATLMLRGPASLPVRFRVAS